MSNSRLVNVVAFVEATTFEESCIWADFVEKYKLLKNSEWRQDGGFLKTVGTYKQRPINITCSLVTIKGKLVCFYDDVSELVDHKMIKDWIQNQSTQKDVVYTDAQNFHIALNRVELG